MPAEQITQELEEAPAAPDQVYPKTFVALANAFLAWMKRFALQLVTWTSQVNTVSTNVNANAELAADWAEKAEDSEVETGKYSALHHAAKASASATAAAGQVVLAAGQVSLAAGQVALAEYQAGLAAASAAQAALAAPAYDPDAYYSFPQITAGVDGLTYRCLGTDVHGDNPVGSVTGNWANIAGGASATSSFFFSQS